MNQKALISIAAIVILLIAGIGAFAVLNDDKGNDSGDDTTPEDNTKPDDNTKPEDKVINDFAGQPVVPVENLDRGIVAVGQDSFRWMTMFGLADKCVMIDMNDMKNFLGKSFMYIGRAQVDIENANTTSPSPETAKHFTHDNGKITTEDVANIIDLNPSIMVVPAEMYNECRNEIQALEKAKVNIVAIDDLYTFLQPGTFQMTDDLVKVIDILSLALDQEKRGAEIKAAFDDTVSALKNYTSKITERKSGYIGGVAYSGAHGVSSSMTYYIPMELAGVNNVMSDLTNTEKSGVMEFKAEKIIDRIAPGTLVFLDASGYSKNTGNQESIGIFKAMNAQGINEACMVMPYIWTGTNYDSVFVDAFQILRYAYGDAIITESQMEQEIKSIYERFYGSDLSTRNIDKIGSKTVPLPEAGTTVLEDMNDFYQVMKGNPVYGTVTINSDGSTAVKP